MNCRRVAGLTRSNFCKARNDHPSLTLPLKPRAHSRKRTARGERLNRWAILITGSYPTQFNNLSSSSSVQGRQEVPQRSDFARSSPAVGACPPLLSHLMSRCNGKMITGARSCPLNMDEPVRKKLFGIITLPAWLLVIWSVFWGIIDWLGRLQLLHDYWPFLRETAQRIAPPSVNVPAFVLSAVWILMFLFVVPPLAQKWGTGKAFAFLMTTIGGAALVLGIVEGQKEINKINQDYHRTHPTKDSSASTR